MLIVCVALVPGTAISTWYHGAGVLLNLAAAAAFACGFEMLMQKLRHQPVTLADHSALVTGLLLGICLPPALPFAQLAFGCLFAIVVAKHLFGGLGRNVFNPAMVGYCVLIVSFPLAMSQWPAADNPLTFAQLLDLKLGTGVADGISGATPLESFRNAAALTLPELQGSGFALSAAQQINTAFLVGGLFLLTMGACRATIPLSVLTTIALLALLFNDGGSSAGFGPPSLHLMAGGTMLGAFFIATDPVTSPATLHGQIVFGIGIGVIAFLVRAIGGYPDGLAFAVLLMNAATPLVDRLTVPRQEIPS